MEACHSKVTQAACGQRCWAWQLTAERLERHASMQLYSACRRSWRVREAWLYLDLHSRRRQHIPPLLNHPHECVADPNLDEMAAGTRLVLGGLNLCMLQRHHALQLVGGQVLQVVQVSALPRKLKGCQGLCIWTAWVARYSGELPTADGRNICWLRMGGKHRTCFASCAHSIQHGP